MLLRGTNGFKNYLWNTGITTSAITISLPGKYWLQVTDQNNCIGRDIIVVNPKECLKGPYVPSGFTPDNNGRNDLLKPFLFGNVKSYQFRLITGWGNLFFKLQI